MRLEDLVPGSQAIGVVPHELVTVLALDWHGPDAVTLVFKTAAGTPDQRVLYRSDEAGLNVAQVKARPFDADAADFKLAAEASRIQLAGLFDPMLAVTTSDVEPLPHQIRAVYGELLPRIPLRFLLADDPGAGKTIMAGLYVKELLLRDDVRRCLIVAPGGLVEQWQDELYFKFGLRFELLTSQLVEAAVGGSVFERHPRLIARMDQLARNEVMRQQLGVSEWDLVIVDEAHRMGAHYYGGKLEKTRRFELGEVLGDITRHLLLMTATPHSGKEEDFQLFLTLLDRDRFEGRYRRDVHTGATDGVMRRMVKEDLLTFDGKPLFPERVAQTVPYQLSPLETELYDEVTTYVREGMNRADRLDGKRRTTVGFALTVLQRRLASSPAAIHQSLLRRAARLRRRRQELADGIVRETVRAEVDLEVYDDDELNAAEMEELEEELVDAATAARTMEELDVELADLDDLVRLAGRVREAGTDRKWGELRGILEHEALVGDRAAAGWKIIVFTEHRDTLDYLVDRIRTVLGRPEAVEAMHGGVRRAERRRITEEFTKNPDCRILLATDAAGEGLNLQAAHLMVNYDLPWNPNRIEQRFGRVHRIGQQEVCRLWNLVASNTREGEVFQRLLDKVEEQRKAYGGKVFDVLGAAFDEVPLRSLLIEAIRYGELPATRARMHEVIDARVSEGLPELLEQQALAKDAMRRSEVDVMRREMEEARAHRLQPHYISRTFRESFARLGGRLTKRERDRFEITHVPASLLAGAGPIATRYERVTFDLSAIELDGARADLLAPGHPLHDVVIAQAARRWAPALESGTVLVSGDGNTPRMLVGVVQEIVDGTGARIARRFGYVVAAEDGSVSPAGPAPYLDCVGAPEGDAARRARLLPWLAGAEKQAVSWIIAHQLPDYVTEVQPRRLAELDRTREAVSHRLNLEVNRLAGEAMAAADKEVRGERPRESSESLGRKAVELEARMDGRLVELDKQARMSTMPPRVASVALVIPLSWAEGELPGEVPLRAVATEEVERRGVDAVLTAERALGRTPKEMPHSNPGYDVMSTAPDGTPVTIEVKARIAGADDFFVSHTEVLTAKNAQPRYRLALVRVSPDGPWHDEVRYVADPFSRTELGDFAAVGVTCHWTRMWESGRAPF